MYSSLECIVHFVHSLVCSGHKIYLKMLETKQLTVTIVFHSMFIYFFLSIWKSVTTTKFLLKMICLLCFQWGRCLMFKDLSW